MCHGFRNGQKVHYLDCPQAEVFKKITGYSFLLEFFSLLYKCPQDMMESNDLKMVSHFLTVKKTGGAAKTGEINPPS